MPTAQTHAGSQKSKPDSPDSLRGKALAEALKFLQREWNWSGPDLFNILHIPTSTINLWLRQGAIPVAKPFSPETQAIIALIAIHKNLNAMFQTTGDQLKWLKASHPEMKMSPLEKMSASIEGLIGVRQYLDYVRGRGA